MTALDGRSWRPARRVTDLLAKESALTTAGLAARLGVTEADLRAPIAMLLGRGLIERCGDYLVLHPTSSAGPE